MYKRELYRFQYDNLTVSTTFWLLEIARELNIIVENVCWVNKRNPSVKTMIPKVADPDENYVCQVTLTSDNKKKLKFINYLFSERKSLILKLYHCYNKEHKNERTNNGV